MPSDQTASSVAVSQAQSSHQTRQEQPPQPQLLQRQQEKRAVPHHRRLKEDEEYRDEGSGNEEMIRHKRGRPVGHRDDSEE